MRAATALPIPTKLLHHRKEKQTDITTVTTVKQCSSGTSFRKSSVEPMLKRVFSFFNALHAKVIHF